MINTSTHQNSFVSLSITQPTQEYRAACPTLLCHSLLPSRTVQEMSKLFKQQSIRKAAGPDNVSSFTLKNCANELDPVFTDLFNASLHQNTAPVCVKAATIIPLQNKPRKKALDDFRPVTLMSMVMKVLEQLVLTYLKFVATPVWIHSRSLKWTTDALMMLLHWPYTL